MMEEAKKELVRVETELQRLTAAYPGHQHMEDLSVVCDRLHLVIAKLERGA